jgi:hypothetical protein
MGAGLTIGVFVWVGVQVAPALAPPVVTQHFPLYVDAQHTTTTTTTETDKQVSVSLFDDFVCADAVDAAQALGWRMEDLDELSYIIWRESRCLSHVHYADDPNGGSHGLTQINGYWCKPSRWYPDGYLQTQGVLSSCEDLYNPFINLYAALVIFNYSSIHNSNGWQPWAIQKDFCLYVHHRCQASALVGGSGGVEPVKEPKQDAPSTCKVVVLTRTQGRKK